MESKNNKKIFRQKCFGIKRHNRYYYSKKIGQKLYSVAKNYQNILFFIPVGGEADIYWVLKKLRRERKNIFVPFMEDLSFKMVKYQLPLVKKKFSILEPVNKQKTLQKIDLAVVPVVGMDGSFRRVGFGKGMYDRFFSSLGYKPRIVFVQLRLCCSKDVVTDDYDVMADKYISFNIYKRRKNERSDNFSRYDIIRSRGICHCKKNGCGKI